MGRTYYAKKNHEIDFDVNVAGAHALGIVHKTFGLPIIPPHPKAPKAPDDDCPCTLFKMTRKQCIAAGTKLAAVTDDAIKALVIGNSTRQNVVSLFDGTPEDFLAWVRD